MALNTDYMLAPSLQEYFVDKDTGLPLAGGFVYFYIDNTNIPKSVFEIVQNTNTGNYSYVALPDPLILSAVGTIVDNNGNDILPYYYPYDSPPSNPNRKVELYTIAVYDSNMVLQFTRFAWPNFSPAELTVDNDVTNFVPNGQFLLHNNLPIIYGNVVGQITKNTTTVAQGGWY